MSTVRITWAKELGKINKCIITTIILLLLKLLLLPLLILLVIQSNILNYFASVPFKSKGTQQIMEKFRGMCTDSKK